MSEEAPELTPEQKKIEQSRRNTMLDADFNSTLTGYMGGDNHGNAMDTLRDDAQEEDNERTANIADDALRFELDEKGENGRLVSDQEKVALLEKCKLTYSGVSDTQEYAYNWLIDGTDENGHTIHVRTYRKWKGESDMDTGVPMYEATIDGVATSEDEAIDMFEKYSPDGEFPTKIGD